MTHSQSCSHPLVNAPSGGLPTIFSVTATLHCRQRPPPPPPHHSTPPHPLSRSHSYPVEQFCPTLTDCTVCGLQRLAVNMCFLSGSGHNVLSKKVPLRWKNCADPGFARSHLDPPEGALSGAQSWGQDVWTGGGLDQSPPPPLPRLGSVLDHTTMTEM